MMSTVNMSPRKVREEILWDRTQDGCTLIEAKTYGSNTWIAYIDPEGVKHIELALIEKVGGGETSYKIIPESAGPAYYDCPLHFLDIVPVANTEFAREWRDKVRSRSKRIQQARSLLTRRGARVQIFGCIYTTMGYAQGRSWVVRAESGGLAKLPPRYVEHVEMA